MKRKLATLLKLLATGTFTVFIAACYGVMMQWKKITALAPEGAGIKALEVTLHDGAMELETVETDAAGIAMVDSIGPMEGLTVSIEDVDGAANGGDFQKADLVLDQSDEYVVSMVRR